MLEILIIIAVVKGFCSVAEGKGRSKGLWGTIGALSYYVPILLMSFLVLPALVAAGALPFVTQDNVFFVAILINLGTGILCCLVAYMVLRGMSDLNHNPYAQPAAHGNFPNHPVSREQDDNPYRPSA